MVIIIIIIIIIKQILLKCRWVKKNLEEHCTINNTKQAVREAATICGTPCKLPVGWGHWLCSRLRPDVRDRQTSDRRQTRIVA